MLTGIYRIVNKLNGKCYIGQSIDIERRFRDHKSRSFTTKYETPIYKAFQKYGIDNFSFEIIEECSTENLDDREIFYIAKYRSAEKKYGYNFTFGGKGYHGTNYTEQRELWSQHIAEGKTGKKIGHPSKEALAHRSAALKGLKKPESWCKKMSVIMKGREITPETRAKISATLTGSKLSEETKEKLRVASTGRVQTEEARQKISQKLSKKICKLDADGNTIAVFDNARAATAETGINFTNISSCCNGGRKKAGGFGWKFYSE